ncbi:MAG: allose kinase [Lachnospiraceae bacterium]|nr:allose kinase [Lachnospiraceae bacterium]
MKGIAGVDLGGTNIRLGISNDKGEIKNFKREKVKSFLREDGQGNAERLADFIAGYIRENGGEKEVAAICAGLPATLNRNRDTLVQAPNIRGLDGAPLKRMIEERTGVRAILERDVNLLFYNDMKELDIPENGINIGIYAGTGIGNSIFINGEPLTGADGAAGELGHIPFGRSEVECGCGNRGCAECLAGGKYLSTLQKTKFKDNPIGSLFIDHGDSSEILEFVDSLARVAATEINILNPDSVVLGGGVVAMEGFPADSLKEAIYEHSRKPFPAENLKIYFSSDAPENGVKGAIAFGYKKMK